MFKLILVVLIIAMLISLGGALKHLFRERGLPTDQSKTMKWLTIRISLAVAIAIVIMVGLMTGELTIGAPWTGQY